MYTIYSGDRCQYCEMAKGIMRALKVEFIEINIDKNPEAKKFIIGAGHRSVPVVYKSDKFIAGGFEDINNYMRGAHS